MDVLCQRNGNLSAGDATVELKKSLMEDQLLTIRFVKLNPDAKTPLYGSAAAAGADLFSAENCVVPAHGEPIALSFVTPLFHSLNCCFEKEPNKMSVIISHLASCRFSRPPIHLRRNK
ncbi:unnamed protein product [Haemonchus placei]|uniref:RanBD1 domain-containing protein n=1 Tax=Haemonchus placei TaxID=6290 RepID=A0A0N4VTY2_HAEPC|nr:unnamed protein product [Haemonchus placei]